MTDTSFPIDVSGSALNVVVQGDKILVLAPGGASIELSLDDARRSLQRLADAIAVAQGRTGAQPPISESISESAKG